MPTRECFQYMLGATRQISGSVSGLIRIRIRINPEIRICIPDEILDLAESALPKCCCN